MLDHIVKRSACSVCGLETFRHKGWFLVVENRWLDRLKILSWHSSLATQAGMRSVCCREHLKSLLVHWLSQASLRVPASPYPPMPLGTDPSLRDIDLDCEPVGQLVELAVHRESFSRVWAGSAAELECILDAIISNETMSERPKIGCRLFDLRPEPSHGVCLQ